MPITAQQVHLIRQAHAAGLLDPQIAATAEVSLATVKRYRTRLGLETNCGTARRGRFGERLVAELAIDQGFHVQWRKNETDEYDLIINGRRTDAKATMRQQDGAWRFRLPTTRPSHYGRYRYVKRYDLDCDVLALVCLFPDGHQPDVYLMESEHAPRELRIHAGGAYKHLKDDWTVYRGGAQALQA